MCVSSGMVKRMEQDQKRFGHASWAMATPRQEKLRVLLAKETLQYMRAKEMCIKRKRDEIRERVCVCVCVCEREKESVCVCVCVCESEKESVCASECVYVCERERVCV